MHGLELVVALGAALLVGSVLADRIRVAQPIVLVACGLALAAIPQLRGTALPHEVVLLLFLPPLLYWESLTTSPREMRRFIRGILLNGTLLVVVTAGIVAVVVHAFGVAWPVAWVVGAAVAPTDATATAALGRLLPFRTMTTLRGESLINDGPALVVYAIAVEALTSAHTPSAPAIGGMFLLSFLGGIAVGAALGWLIHRARKPLTDPTLDTLANVLTPFLVYLVAEVLHVSGVVAVVVAGLYMSQVAPKSVSARSRSLSTPFFTLSTFLLNGALFVLIGLELPEAIGELSATTLVRAVLIAVAVWATTLVARLVFITTAIGIIRLLDRRPEQRTMRTTARGRIVSTVAGFRGAISLAVALSVPVALSDGSPQPGRDLVVCVTAIVVVLSLVVQGLALPRLVRWAHLPEDTTVDEETELARRIASEEAMEALPELADELGLDSEVVRSLRERYEQKRAAMSDRESEGFRERFDDARRLQLAVIGHKRETVVRLRDERTIDDTALRRIQATLDAEELRLTGGAEVE